MVMIPVLELRAHDRYIPEGQAMIQKDPVK